MLKEAPSNTYARPTGEELEEYRRMYHSHPSWETVAEIMERRTHNVESRHRLFEKYRPLLRDYYDAWFNVVTGRGYTKLVRFHRENSTEDKLPVITSLSHHLNIIRSTLVNPFK